MNGNVKKERRKHQRFPLHMEILLSDGKFFVNSISSNVSLGGIGIESSKKMEAGSHVTLVLGTEPPLKVQGIVRWCAKKGLKYQAGIQFTDLDKVQEIEINQFLSSSYWDITSGQ